MAHGAVLVAMRMRSRARREAAVQSPEVLVFRLLSGTDSIENE